MKSSAIAAVLLIWSAIVLAGGTDSAPHLFKKFQTKGCTHCHDFFEKELGGLSYKSHKGRTSDICVYCYTKEVTGFAHVDEWFARSGLYTSGMNSQQTCEAVKTALHAKFKNQTLLAR